MPGGAYSALSGMQTRLEELDRLAADLANIGTSGYKTERAAKSSAEREAFAAALDSAVDVVSDGTKIDFRGGTLGDPHLPPRHGKHEPGEQREREAHGREQSDRVVEPRAERGYPTPVPRLV